MCLEPLQLLCVLLLSHGLVHLITQSLCMLPGLAQVSVVQLSLRSVAQDLRNKILYSGEIFVRLNVRYQALKAYFRGLIFVVYPEHVIIVAYYPRLLFECTYFRGSIFRFGALSNESNRNNPPRKFPAIQCVLHIIVRINLGQMSNI